MGLQPGCMGLHAVSAYMAWGCRRGLQAAAVSPAPGSHTVSPPPPRRSAPRSTRHSTPPPPPPHAPAAAWASPSAPRLSA
eukprot:scaffold97252_cov64-Phaeocystis_antarctica.AAC.1